MKIDVISDLHLEQWNDYRHDYSAMKRPDCDIIIVAGDLSNNTPQKAIDELKRIALVYKTVLFVEGNGEYRDTWFLKNDFNLAVVKGAISSGIKGMNNVHYLKDGTFIQDGVAFVGRNGHWDYKVDPRITPEQAMIEQAALLKTTPEEIQDVTSAIKDFEDMRAEVIRLNDDPSIHSIVAVTHSVPHIAGTTMLNFPETASPLVMSRMANTRLQEIKAFDTHGKLKHWVFGHQHAAKDLEVNGVRYLSNPLGRPDEIYKKDEVTKYRPATFQVTKPNP